MPDIPESKSLRKEGPNYKVILGGTAAFGLAGAVMGVIGSTARDIPLKPLVPLAGINLASFGGIFFVTRDSLLRQQHRKNQEANLLDGIERDMDSMYASVVAGGVAGALTTLVGGGPRRVPAAVVASMVLAGMGQGIASRLHHYRQDRILQNINKPARPPLPHDEPSPASSAWSWLPIQRLSDREVLNYLYEERYRIRKELLLLDEADTLVSDMSQ